MKRKCYRNTKAGLPVEGSWNAYILSMMGWGEWGQSLATLERLSGPQLK